MVVKASVLAGIKMTKKKRIKLKEINQNDQKGVFLDLNNLS